MPTRTPSCARECVAWSGLSGRAAHRAWPGVLNALMMVGHRTRQGDRHVCRRLDGQPRALRSIDRQRGLMLATEGSHVGAIAGVVSLDVLAASPTGGGLDRARVDRR